MSDAENLQAQVASVAKETANNLKRFSKETAMLLYAKQMENMQMPIFPEGTEHKKANNKEASQKLNKMLDDAKQKWKYADDKAKRKTAEMEKIVNDGNDKIRNLYKEA